VPQPTQTEIREALQAALQRGTSVVLATVSDCGEPSTAFCSWVVAASAGTVALALDSRSTAYRNVTGRSHQVALEVMADGAILSVRGEATVVKEQMNSVPFPCALVAVSIGEVRDHGVDGVTFTAPRYVFADDKQHRGHVERAIFEELRRATLGGDDA